MTDTKTQTLAEFLLARIAEDEADWRAVAARDVVEYLHGVQVAPKMLAECEAKRRIISYFEEFRRLDSWEHYESILGILAAPYADHPDYRREWRA